MTMAADGPDLPPGWVTTRIEDILELLDDGRILHQGWSPQCEKEPRQTDDDWGVLKTTAIQAGVFLPEHNKRLPVHMTPRPLIEVKVGDLLITSAGPRTRCGIACLVRNTPRHLMMSGKMYRFRVPKQHVDARFVDAYLQTVSARDSIERMKTGINDSGLNLTHQRFQQLMLPLAPLNAQRRIVAAIEEQTSRLDAVERLLADARHRLRQLRSALLSSLLASPWPLARIGDVALVGGGATPKRGHAHYWKDGTIPWVTSGQLTEPFVREPAALITERALRETSVKLWPKHTLLVALYGEGKTRGHCSELLIEATTNQACAAIIIEDSSVDRTYLKLFFAASYDAHRRLASGGVQPNLSLGLIKSLTFPLPPIEEQRRIVAETEQRLSLVNALTEALDRALRRSTTLRRAILEQAFNGTLVPQDPSDEPASALLERIAAERVTRPKPSRRRRGVPA
jgi:type I restriction enzyme S subunit